MKKITYTVKLNIAFSSQYNTHREWTLKSMCWKQMQNWVNKLRRNRYSNRLQLVEPNNQIISDAVSEIVTGLNSLIRWASLLWKIVSNRAPAMWPIPTNSTYWIYWRTRPGLLSILETKDETDIRFRSFDWFSHRGSSWSYHLCCAFLLHAFSSPQSPVQLSPKCLPIVWDQPRAVWVCQLRQSVITHLMVLISWKYVVQIEHQSKGKVLCAQHSETRNQ